MYIDYFLFSLKPCFYHIYNLRDFAVANFLLLEERSNDRSISLSILKTVRPYIRLYVIEVCNLFLLNFTFKL